MKRQIKIESRCLAMMPSQEVMSAMHASRGRRLAPVYGACRLERRWPRRRNAGVQEVDGTATVLDREEHSRARGPDSPIVRLILQQLLQSSPVVNPDMAEVMQITNAEAPVRLALRILGSDTRAIVCEQCGRHHHVL